MAHPPSRRRDQSRNNRERSLPRTSDKLRQDLLNLITEPVPENRSRDRTRSTPIVPTGVLTAPLGNPGITGNTTGHHMGIGLNLSGKTDSTDDDLSPRKYSHEHLTEADRQFVPLLVKQDVNAEPISAGAANPVPILHRSHRAKSSSDSVTDERLHRIEKTLREMQIKLDEVLFI